MLPGCETNDKTILSGDIIGMVYLIDEYDHYLSDRSGINVNLIFDDIPVMYTTTDQIGRFYFENIPYGTYRIDLGKEGFVKSLSSHTVYHVGGYSPTQMKYNLYEVPTFELLIDSIEYNGSESSAIYLQLIGVTEMPESGYFIIRCFCGGTPDVSKDNFVKVYPGLVWMYPESLIDQSAIANAYLGFYQVELDSIYLRIYPQASGQGYYDDFSEESLGKPSNIVRFRIK